jgi:hypothetical protein
MEKVALVVSLLAFATGLSALLRLFWRSFVRPPLGSADSEKGQDTLP